MSSEDFFAALAAHEAWLDKPSEGQRCNLGFADLFGFQVDGRRLKFGNLQGSNLARASLRGTDFSQADLFCSNLEGADLRKTVLDGADMRGAFLYGANLEGASLEGTDLRAGTLLCGYRKSDPRFQTADLRDANLNDASLRKANLEGADLRSASFMNASLAGANLTGCDLSGANLSGADLRGASLRGIKLDGAATEGCIVDPAASRMLAAPGDDETDWSAASEKPMETVISEHALWLKSGRREGVRADLSNRDLRRQRLVNVTLDHAILRGTRLSGAWLCNVTFVMSDLALADLTGTVIDHCSFDGATATRCSFEEAIIAHTSFRSVLGDPKQGGGRETVFPANLVDSTFENARIEGCDFTGATVRGAKFEGAFLGDTKLSLNETPER